MTLVEHLRTKGVHVHVCTGTNMPDTPYGISIQHDAGLCDRLTILTGWLIVMPLPLVQVIAMTFAGETLLEVKTHRNRRKEAKLYKQHSWQSQSMCARSLKLQLII
jgi:hypothetical protein